MTASTITSSMTQWPRYKQLEQLKSTATSDDLWQCATVLSSMDDMGKIQLALKKAKDSISNGTLFSSSLHIVSLERLRATYLQIAANGVTFRHKEEMILLQKEVVQLAQEIGKVIGNKESFEASDFSPKLVKLNAALTKLYEKAQAELKNVKEMPIGQDRRCYKAHIKTLDKHFMTPFHSAYVETMNRWQAEEKIFAANTQEQCWQWKGEQKGLKFLITKLAYLAHSVHKCACCLDVLDKNRSNDTFWVATSDNSEEEKSEDKDFDKRKMERLFDLVFSSSPGVSEIASLFKANSGSSSSSSSNT